MKARGSLRWGRLVVATLGAELLLILLLVALVAIAGPGEGNAQEFADHLGRWVGPIGGALVSFTGALWLARPLARGRVLHGLLLGICLALLDVGILVASRTAFEWVFVGSNLGKIAAGSLGGIVAKHKSASQ